MMQAVWASQDREGLREAIWSYLTELPAARRKRQSGEMDPNYRSRREAHGGRFAALPYAFQLWIAHLALLEQVLEMTPIPWQELRAAELEGLLLLRAARERFRREYRACAECGAPVKGKICPRCGNVGSRE